MDTRQTTSEESDDLETSSNGSSSQNSATRKSDTDIVISKNVSANGSGSSKNVSANGTGSASTGGSRGSSGTIHILCLSSALPKQI